MTVQSDCQPSRQALVISSFVMKWSDFSTCHPPVSVSYHCPGHSLCNFLCVVIKWWLSDWKWLLKLNLSFSQNILFKKKIIKKRPFVSVAFNVWVFFKKELFTSRLVIAPVGVWEWLCCLWLWHQMERSIRALPLAWRAVAQGDEGGTRRWRWHEEMKPQSNVPPAHPPLHLWAGSSPARSGGLWEGSLPVPLASCFFFYSLYEIN